MEHFSERLQRNYQAGDWLRASEALEILSANSGRRIADAHLTRLLARGDVRAELPPGSKRRVYLYDDLAARIVPQPGHTPDEENTKSNVRAQRAWRARQREKKALALQEQRGEYKPE